VFEGFGSEAGGGGGGGRLIGGPGQPFCWWVECRAGAAWGAVAIVSPSTVTCARTVEASLGVLGAARGGLNTTTLTSALCFRVCRSVCLHGHPQRSGRRPSGGRGALRAHHATVALARHHGRPSVRGGMETPAAAPLSRRSPVDCCEPPTATTPRRVPPHPDAPTRSAQRAAAGARGCPPRAPLRTRRGVRGGAQHTAPTAARCGAPWRRACARRPRPWPPPPPLSPSLAPPPLRCCRRLGRWRHLPPRPRPRPPPPPPPPPTLPPPTFCHGGGRCPRRWLPVNGGCRSRLHRRRRWRQWWRRPRPRRQQWWRRPRPRRRRHSLATRRHGRGPPPRQQLPRKDAEAVAPAAATTSAVAAAATVAAAAAASIVLGVEFGSTTTTAETHGGWESLCRAV